MRKPRLKEGWDSLNIDTNQGLLSAYLLQGTVEAPWYVVSFSLYCSAPGGDCSNSFREGRRS